MLMETPAEVSSDQRTISQNIGTLISEGYKRDQAAAIAYDKANRSKKRK